MRGHLATNAAGSGPRKDFSGLEECRDVQISWNEHASVPGVPSFPEDLDAIGDEMRSFVADLRRLEEISRGGIWRHSTPRSAARLENFAAHRDTLLALPAYPCGEGPVR